MILNTQNKNYQHNILSCPKPMSFEASVYSWKNVDLTAERRRNYFRPISPDYLQSQKNIRD